MPTANLVTASVPTENYITASVPTEGYVAASVPTGYSITASVTSTNPTSDFYLMSSNKLGQPKVTAKDNKRLPEISTTNAKNVITGIF